MCTCVRVWGGYAWALTEGMEGIQHRSTETCWAGMSWVAGQGGAGQACHGLQSVPVSASLERPTPLTSPNLHLHLPPPLQPHLPPPLLPHLPHLPPPSHLLPHLPLPEHLEQLAMRHTLRATPPQPGQGCSQTQHARSHKDRNKATTIQSQTPCHTTVPAIPHHATPYTILPHTTPSTIPPHTFTCTL